MFVVKIFKEKDATHGVNFVPGVSKYLTSADKKVLDNLDTATTGLRGNITPYEAWTQLARVNNIRKLNFNAFFHSSINIQQLQQNK